MGRHILLTGGTGYLGSHVARDLLRKGDRVTILARSNNRYDSLETVLGYRIDQADLSLAIAPPENKLVDWVVSTSPDAIIHTAASGGAVHKPSDIPALIAANITLGTSLIDAATLLQRDTGRIRPMVFCGSFWQHAGGTDELTANSLYAASKSAFEIIAAYYRHAHEARVMGIKFFDIYGPNDSRKRVIDLLLDAAFSEAAQPFSMGEQIIAPIYVDDAVDAILHAVALLESDYNGALTYAADGPSRLSLRDIAGLIATLTGRTPNVDWGALPYRDEQIFTPAQLTRPPDWAPKISLQIGLEKLIAQRTNPTI